MPSTRSFLDGALRVLREVANRALDRTSTSPRRDAKLRATSPHPPAAPASAGYPGDYTQRPTIVYQPLEDGRPDPGEIVWTWVPYEEDHSQGKDRPVLLIARDGRWLLGLQVTSQDHDRDAQQEARAGRHWVDIGAGAWDNRRRPSEVRVNRIVRVDPDSVRRIGAILDRATYDEVTREVLRHY